VCGVWKSIVLSPELRDCEDDEVHERMEVVVEVVVDVVVVLEVELEEGQSVSQLPVVSALVAEESQVPSPQYFSS